jgi:hypothetical protein
MKSFTHTAAVLLLLALGTEATGIASVGSKEAAYFGGTVTAFAGARNPIEGHIDTANESVLAFSATDKPFIGQAVSIPYASVIDIEYGQKAGRRVGAAIGYSVLLGPVGLLTLLSKKRNHYLTVGYHGTDGKDQVVVFEIGKDIIRTTLAIVEARSGKKIVYQDADAQRSESRADQTWTGEISSSNCGTTHTQGTTARECTQECVDGGAQYVFVSKAKVYKLAKQDDEQLRAHAGETVTLTGDLKGDTITASKIEAMTPKEQR